MQVDDGTKVDVELQNWPREEPVSNLACVLKDYWPPMGCRVAIDSEAELAQVKLMVDLQSEASLIRFESDLGLRVAEKLDGYVAIHAALIIIGASVVIIPGASHTGKSTLSHAAIAAGNRVLSDEYALISTKTGLARGWTRPIRRRMPGGALIRTPIPQDSLEYQPTHVIDMRFDPASNNPLLLEEISGGEAAFSLLRNTLCAQSRPEESLRAVASVSREVRGLRGLRSEAADALTALTSLVASS